MTTYNFKFVVKIEKYQELLEYWGLLDYQVNRLDIPFQTKLYTYLHMVRVNTVYDYSDIACFDSDIACCCVDIWYRLWSFCFRRFLHCS